MGRGRGGACISSSRVEAGAPVMIQGSSSQRTCLCARGTSNNTCRRFWLLELWGPPNLQPCFPGSPVDSLQVSQSAQSYW